MRAEWLIRVANQQKCACVFCVYIYALRVSTFSRTKKANDVVVVFQEQISSSPSSVLALSK